MILKRYQLSFQNKRFDAEETETDLLMDLFGITPAQKKENPTYWGRELGSCWENIVVSQAMRKGLGAHPQLGKGKEAPVDIAIGLDGIDLKYRIGYGDSKIINKMKQNATLIKKANLLPVLLILRDDSRVSTINSLKKNWTIYQGEQSLEYVKVVLGLDIREFLKAKKDQYLI